MRKILQVVSFAVFLLSTKAFAKEDFNSFPLLKNLNLSWDTSWSAALKIDVCKLQRMKTIKSTKPTLNFFCENSPDYSGPYYIVLVFDNDKLQTIYIFVAHESDYLDDQLKIDKKKYKLAVLPVPAGTTEGFYAASDMELLQAKYAKYRNLKSSAEFAESFVRQIPPTKDKVVQRKLRFTPGTSYDFRLENHTDGHILFMKNCSTIHLSKVGTRN